MSIVGFEQILLLPILQNVHNFSGNIGLANLSQLNKKTCAFVIKYIHEIKIGFLQEQGFSLTTTMVVHLQVHDFTDTEATIPKELTTLGQDIFFDIHWANLLMYASKLKKISKETRRGHCIRTIINQLREQGLQGKYAFLLIQKILTLGWISNKDKQVALQLNNSASRFQGNHQDESKIAYLLLHSEKKIPPTLNTLKKDEIELLQDFLLSNDTRRIVDLHSDE